MRVTRCLDDIELGGLRAGPCGVGRERLQGDRAARVTDGGGRDGLGGQGEQVDGFVVRGGGVAELGQEEEVVDEQAHAVGVVSDQGVRLVAAGAVHRGGPSAAVRRSPGRR